MWCCMGLAICHLNAQFDEADSMVMRVYREGLRPKLETMEPSVSLELVKTQQPSQQGAD